MGLFHHKKKDKEVSEDLLAEIEKEVGEPKLAPAPAKSALPPAPAMPTAPKPPAAPAPPAGEPAPSPVVDKPALGTEDVAKLPLFMKVKEYDKIVKELADLTTSLSKIENVLKDMTDLEKKEE
ncbi:MAG: hypothetical protein ABIF92_02740, partial [archaeon]